MQRLQEFLLKSEFFSTLKPEEVEKIAPFLIRGEYASGDTILTENGSADRFYVIESGSVEVWKGFGTENAALLAVRTTGHIFGEMSLIDDGPRSATVIAAEESVILHMEKQDFYNLSEEHPSIMLAVLRALSKVIRSSNESFINSLSRQNRELQNALDDLQDTQQELIRNERFSNLGKLSSLIIHDLRNPLSVIKGYGEMLQVLNDDPEQVSTYARKIVQETLRLNRFAQELLDYSRGEPRLVWGFTSLPMIFQKFRQYLGKTYQDAGIEVVISYDGKEGFYVDEERLIRVILNLCDNARKAMAGGGILNIDAVQTVDLLRITVTDTGSGMDEEVLAHIFEPFYSSSHGGGTGLGMVSVKNVVDAHNGEVQIRSKPGAGTSVTIILPRNEELPE